MIVDVIFEKTIYHAPPARCEAGTGDIADAVGVAAAFDDVEAIGMGNVTRHEHDLLIDATHGLKSIPGLGLIGAVKEKAAVLSCCGRIQDRGSGCGPQSRSHCSALRPLLRAALLRSVWRGDCGAAIAGAIRQL